MSISSFGTKLFPEDSSFCIQAWQNCAVLSRVDKDSKILESKTCKVLDPLHLETKFAEVALSILIAPDGNVTVDQLSGEDNVQITTTGAVTVRDVYLPRGSLTVSGQSFSNRKARVIAIDGIEISADVIDNEQGSLVSGQDVSLCAKQAIRNIQGRILAGSCKAIVADGTDGLAPWKERWQKMRMLGERYFTSGIFDNREGVIRARTVLKVVSLGPFSSIGGTLVGGCAVSLSSHSPMAYSEKSVVKSSLGAVTIVTKAPLFIKDGAHICAKNSITIHAYADIDLGRSVLEAGGECTVLSTASIHSSATISATENLCIKSTSSTVRLEQDSVLDSCSTTSVQAKDSITLSGVIEGTIISMKSVEGYIQTDTKSMRATEELRVIAQKEGFWQTGGSLIEASRIVMELAGHMHQAEGAYMHATDGSITIRAFSTQLDGRVHADKQPLFLNVGYQANRHIASLVKSKSNPYSCLPDVEDAGEWGSPEEIEKERLEQQERREGTCVIQTGELIGHQVAITTSGEISLSHTSRIGGEGGVTIEAEGRIFIEGESVITSQRALLIDSEQGTITTGSATSIHTPENLTLAAYLQLDIQGRVHGGTDLSAGSQNGHVFNNGILTSDTRVFLLTREPGKEIWNAETGIIDAPHILMRSSGKIGQEVGGNIGLKAEHLEMHAPGAYLKGMIRAKKINMHFGAEQVEIASGTIVTQELMDVTAQGHLVIRKGVELHSTGDSLSIQAKGEILVESGAFLSAKEIAKVVSTENQMIFEPEAKITARFTECAAQQALFFRGTGFGEKQFNLLSLEKDIIHRGGALSSKDLVLIQALKGQDQHFWNEEKSTIEAPRIHIQLTGDVHQTVDSRLSSPEGVIQIRTDAAFLRGDIAAKKIILKLGRKGVNPDIKSFIDLKGTNPYLDPTPSSASAGASSAPPPEATEKKKTLSISGTLNLRTAKMVATEEIELEGYGELSVSNDATMISGGRLIGKVAGRIFVENKALVSAAYLQLRSWNGIMVVRHNATLHGTEVSSISKQTLYVENDSQIIATGPLECDAPIVRIGERGLLQGKTALIFSQSTTWLYNDKGSVETEGKLYLEKMKVTNIAGAIRAQGPIHLPQSLNNERGKIESGSAIFLKPEGPYDLAELGPLGLVAARVELMCAGVVSNKYVTTLPFSLTLQAHNFTALAPVTFRGFVDLKVQQLFLLHAKCIAEQGMQVTARKIHVHCGQLAIRGGVTLCAHDFELEAPHTTVNRQLPTTRSFFYARDPFIKRFTADLPSDQRLHPSFFGENVTAWLNKTSWQEHQFPGNHLDTFVAAEGKCTLQFDRFKNMGGRVVLVGPTKLTAKEHLVNHAGEVTIVGPTQLKTAHFLNSTNLCFMNPAETLSSFINIMGPCIADIALGENFGHISASAGFMPKGASFYSQTFPALIRKVWEFYEIKRKGGRWYNRWKSYQSGWLEKQHVYPSQPPATVSSATRIHASMDHHFTSMGNMHAPEIVVRAREIHNGLIPKGAAQLPTWLSLGSLRRESNFFVRSPAGQYVFVPPVGINLGAHLPHVSLPSKPERPLRLLMSPLQELMLLVPWLQQHAFTSYVLPGTDALSALRENTRGITTREAMERLNKPGLVYLEEEGALVGHLYLPKSVFDPRLLQGTGAMIADQGITLVADRVLSTAALKTRHLTIQAQVCEILTTVRKDWQKVKGYDYVGSGLFGKGRVRSYEHWVEVTRPNTQATVEAESCDMAFTNSLHIKGATFNVGKGGNVKLPATRVEALITQDVCHLPPGSRGGAGHAFLPKFTPSVVHMGKQAHVDTHSLDVVGSFVTGAEDLTITADKHIHQTTLIGTSIVESRKDKRRSFERTGAIVQRSLIASGGSLHTRAPEISNLGGSWVAAQNITQMGNVSNEMAVTTLIRSRTCTSSSKLFQFGSSCKLFEKVRVQKDLETVHVERPHIIAGGNSVGRFERSRKEQGLHMDVGGSIDVHASTIHSQGVPVVTKVRVKTTKIGLSILPIVSTVHQLCNARNTPDAVAAAVHTGVAIYHFNPLSQIIPSPYVSQSITQSTHTDCVPTEMRAGGSIVRKADIQELHDGVVVHAGNDLLIAGDKKLQIAAREERLTSVTRQRRGQLSYPSSISFGYTKGSAESRSYHRAHLSTEAGKIALSSHNEITSLGSALDAATTVEVTAPFITHCSLQDSSSSQSNGFDLSLDLGSLYRAVVDRDYTLIVENASLAGQHGSSKRLWTEQQAVWHGSSGVNVDAPQSLRIQGAVIRSNKGVVRCVTSQLLRSDLADSEKSLSLGLSTGSIHLSSSIIATPDLSYTHSARSGISRATIADDRVAQEVIASRHSHVRVALPIIDREKFAQELEQKFRMIQEWFAPSLPQEVQQPTVSIVRKVVPIRKASLEQKQEQVSVSKRPTVQVIKKRVSRSTPLFKKRTSAQKTEKCFVELPKARASKERAHPQIAQLRTTEKQALSVQEVMLRNAMVDHMLTNRLLSVLPELAERGVAYLTAEALRGAPWVLEGIDWMQRTAKAGVRRFCGLNSFTQGICDTVVSVRDQARRNREANIQAFKEKYAIPTEMSEQYYQDSIRLPLRAAWAFTPLPSTTTAKWVHQLLQLHALTRQEPGQRICEQPSKTSSEDAHGAAALLLVGSMGKPDWKRVLTKPPKTQLSMREWLLRHSPSPVPQKRALVPQRQGRLLDDTVKQICSHAIQRIIERGVRPHDLLHLLKHPVVALPPEITPVGPKQLFMNRSLACVINTKSKRIITVFPPNPKKFKDARAKYMPPFQKTVVKALKQQNRSEIEEHYLGLSAHDRHLRFMHSIGEKALKQFVRDIDFTKSRLLGTYKADANGLAKLVAVSLLTEDSAPGVMEVALSTHFAHQRSGVGTELMAKAMEQARNLGYSRLKVVCMGENQAMLGLSKKMGATMHFDPEWKIHEGFINLTQPTESKALVPISPPQYPRALTETKTIPQEWLGGHESRASLHEGSYYIATDQEGPYISLRLSGLTAYRRSRALTELWSNVRREAAAFGAERGFLTAPLYHHARFLRVFERRYGGREIGCDVTRYGGNLYAFSLKSLHPKQDHTVSHLPAVLQLLDRTMREVAAAEQSQPLDFVVQEAVDQVAEQLPYYHNMTSTEQLLRKILGESQRDHVVVVDKSPSVVEVTVNENKFIARVSTSSSPVLELQGLEFYKSLNLQRMLIPSPLVVGQFGMRKTQNFLIKTYLSGKTLPELFAQIAPITHPRGREQFLHHFTEASHQMGRAIAELHAKSPPDLPFVSSQLHDPIDLLYESMEDLEIRETAYVRSLVEAYKKNPGERVYDIPDLSPSSCLWSKKLGMFGIFDMEFAGAHETSFAAKYPYLFHSMFDTQGILAGMSLEEIAKLKQAFDAGFKDLMRPHPPAAQEFFQLVYEVDAAAILMDELRAHKGTFSPEIEATAQQYIDAVRHKIRYRRSKPL